MKEWIVIHQIKALYNQGNGLSERQIAKELGISRNTG
jgi:transposase